MTVKAYKEQEQKTRLKLLALGTKLSKQDICRIASKLNYGEKSVYNYVNGCGQNLLTGLQILEAAKP